MKFKSSLLFALGAASLLVSTAGAAPDDVLYAPADTALIVYSNGPAISSSKVFQAFRATAFFRENIETPAQQTLAAGGLSLDDGLSAEVAAFAALPAKPGADIQKSDSIVRYRRPVADKVLEFAGTMLASEAENGGGADKKSPVTRGTIGGKPAVTVSFPEAKATLIALDNDLMQWSIAVDGGAPALLSKRPATALTAAIDTEALISVAYIPADSAAVEAALPEEARAFFTGLKSAKLNLRNADGRLAAKAELVYSDPETAKMMRQQLRMLVGVFQAAAEEDGGAEAQPTMSPELRALLKGVRISGRGTRVAVELGCTDDEAIRLLQQQLK